MKWIPLVLIICASCFLSACSATSQKLLEHPRAVVRYPAKAGETVGSIIGIPVTIVCLPVSLAVGACVRDHETAVWAPLYPYAVTVDVFTTIFAGPPWLVFGWWGKGGHPIPAKTDGVVRHVVMRNQDLKEIVGLYGVDAETIKRFNGLKGDDLRVGQELMIPPVK